MKPRSIPALKLVKGLNRGDARKNPADCLRGLKTRYGASGLKLSTEDAAMSLRQIGYWNQLCAGIMPVVVKIGGPNARNDVKQLVALNVDGLIAPMVESVYGLENYIEAIRDFTTPIRFKTLDKHINIETITAVEHLDEILNSPLADLLDEITIGCKDLSKSMKKSVHDKHLRERVKDVVQRIKSRQITVSIGGGITPDSIDEVLDEIQPDRFNTRLITFDVKPGNSYHDAVCEALQFEMLMLANDSKEGFISREEEKLRISEIKKRLKSAE